ncbi:MAG: hypothetical protein LUQ65_01555 [Candidatus Helarchaeota archaeon]|nr:hypothetical protein [Candidatus Helarchaeota archaeon]
MNSVFIYFIPTLDENDGKLIYVAEPFIKQKYFEKAVIVMPKEFSIVLEDEGEELEKEPSKIVKLTFWDLLQTFPELNIAATFIVYHKLDLDRIGSQLEGIGNQLWGANFDHILDTIYISRALYEWLKKQLDTEEMDKDLVQECINFHKRKGIVGIDENDPVQKVFFERAVLMKRKEHVKKGKIQASISGVADLFEKEAYLKADRFWEELKAAGRILYYQVGDSPLI